MAATHFKALVCYVLMTALLLLSACAAPPARRPASRPPKQAPAPERTIPPETTPPAPSTPSEIPAPRDQAVEPPRETPRTVASLRLTEQARAYLDSGRPDQAIRTLERAVNLNPSSGENFYYLSEAWLMKGNLRQAQEFNRLAGLHLKRDAGWMARVSEQAERINRRLGK